MKTYRDIISDKTYDYEENGKEYTETDTITEILDDIETKVNEIQDSLSQYSNLTEINDINEEVKALSKCLY